MFVILSTLLAIRQYNNPHALINSAVECGRPHAIVAPTRRNKNCEQLKKYE